MRRPAGKERKPRIFIGSSKEGKQIAEYLQLGLEGEAETTLWSQGVFLLTRGTLESLMQVTRNCDFAVLVLSPDDWSAKRGVESRAPRDNVLFELGLFMGALGRDRTFVVSAKDEMPEIPSDLAGVTLATDASREDGNLQAALGPVCTEIKAAIRRAASQISAPRDGRRQTRRRKIVARRRRRRSLGLAKTAAPGQALRIVDISATGALLETEGEIPVGQILNLSLDFENGASARVTARVARVQYPAWGRIGGVGVAFTEFDGRSEEIIKDYTSAGADASDAGAPGEEEPDGSGGE
jgi:predicted nucleotide-binding protein with TIR-like domain/PilZ domain-containing protein